MRWLIIVVSALTAFIGTRKWAEMVRQNAIKQVEEEASFEKIRFLQRLDHELKNPLTAMQIALANLEDDTNRERHAEIRASMRGQILRLSHLISDLRKLVSLEKAVIEQIPVNIGDLLTEVTLITQDNGLTSQRNFRAEFNDAELPVISGDRDLLQLAIYNLLDNAFKFTRIDDTIVLKAHVEGEELIIQVIDTGRGIPEIDIPHVWKDLYQSSDVRGIPGSGIGLAMVKGIIENHDGTVNINSIYGKGTTISLRLPCNYKTI